MHMIEKKEAAIVSVKLAYRAYIIKAQTGIICGQSGTRNHQDY